MNTQEELLKSVESKKTYFKTQSYSMSVGELKNLYEDGEIKINPDYQRFFRWTQGQKVRLIESILMGIPIPSIFVYEDKEGKWELVDGLQRVSTLLQCMGVLKDGDGNLMDALVLNGTKYIPQMEGFSWNDKDDSKQIPDPLKLAIRRSKIDITIILNESDPNAKFEVFQRLNTGGSNASDQEVRNNVMIMMNVDAYKWFDLLSQNIDFNNAISISDKQESEQYHKDLLMRFIALSHYSFEVKKDISDFLDDINLELVTASAERLEEIKQNVEKTFAIINKAYEDKSFKKDQKGKFLESAFEAISVGISKNINDYSESDEDISIIKEKICALYEQDFYKNNAGSGSNAKSRISKIIPSAIEYFKK